MTGLSTQNMPSYNKFVIELAFVFLALALYSIMGFQGWTAVGILASLAGAVARPAFLWKKATATQGNRWTQSQTLALQTDAQALRVRSPDGRFSPEDVENLQRFMRSIAAR